MTVRLRFSRAVVAVRGGRHVLALRAVTMLVLVGLLPAYLVSFYVGSDDYSFWADGVLGNAVLVVPAAACLGRALLVRSQRLPFTLIGLGAAAFAAGNTAYVFDVQFLDPVPYPSVADIGYLVPYPLIFAAVLLLAQRDLRRVPLSTLLDALLGALSCASAGSIITVHRVLPDLNGSTLTWMVGAAYPVADLTLAALIVAVVTLKGGRPGPTWVLLGSGILTFAVADSQYLYRVADGTYSVGTPLDGLWALGLTLIAVAAVLPYRPGGRRVGATPRALILPNAFGLIAVGVLVYGSLTEARLPVYAVVLVTLALVTVVKRTAVGFSALRLLAASQRQARTDELTQLPNRRHFDEQVQQVLGTRAPGEQIAVVMVDLDGFKAVNDTFGHHAGDELLRQIGPRLSRELRPGDLLARLGGDEFGLLLRDCDRETALGLTHGFTAALALPFLVEGAVQNAAASVGIALCPDDGVDLAVLLQRADAAMFDAKARGIIVATYDHDRLGGEDGRLDVREALERHELVVVYQPQFDVADGRMTGVEALVRWNHPTRGLLFPDAFLSFFEQAGLMAELTLEVLERGAQDVRRWARAGTRMHLSVNLAPSALLQDGLIESVAAVMDTQELAADLLTLEVTENVLLGDVERSLRTLTGLRALGIRLSLDDYGTGYCSLTYLRDLPIDEVKIDRSFVMTLEPGTVTAAIVASTVQLAQALGLRTVAEGVETRVALATLRDLGCDVVQGYLLGRPVPPEAILRIPRPRWEGRGFRILPVEEGAVRRG